MEPREVAAVVLMAPSFLFLLGVGTYYSIKWNREEEEAAAAYEEVHGPGSSDPHPYGMAGKMLDEYRERRADKD